MARPHPAWLGVGVAAACGGAEAPPPPTVEARIAQDLAAHVGVPVTRVVCPAGPSPRTCVAEIPGTSGIELRVSDTPEGAEWEVAGFLVSVAPLEVEIALRLDELGVEATVDCGERFRTTQVGDRVPCALAVGGERGAAWAVIVDDDGRFELELVLDPAAATARSAEVDDAELTRRSLELDDAEELGEPDDPAPGPPVVAP
jgi:hypothetical protein